MLYEVITISKTIGNITQEISHLLQKGVVVMIQRFDINQFIDALCERLENTAFEDYGKETELLQDASDVITEYVKDTLEEMASIRVKGQDKSYNFV